jgi:hypothetical protein
MKPSRIFQVSILLALSSSGCRTRDGNCTGDAQCTSPAVCCGNKCVDLQSSLTDCGNCGNVCGAQNAAVRCLSGVCQLTCGSGFADCNANPKDGCETELVKSVKNCGSCGKACTAANASNLCLQGQCQLMSCESGFGDCDAQLSTGCEVDLKSSVIHCGECGHKCEVTNGAAGCFKGLCTVASCSANFGDCDSNPQTGCETDLTSTDEHCGQCDTACGAGFRCRQSKCLAPELIFYGGFEGFLSTTISGEVSSFNVESHVWNRLAPLGTGPAPRFGHLAIWDDTANRMLVWGGLSANNTATDSSMWSLDFSSGQPRWKHLSVAGVVPASRGFMGVAWNSAKRTFYILGGGTQNGSTLSDFWEFDVAALKWTPRTEPGGPGGRSFASMVWDSSKQRVLVGLGQDENLSAPAGFWTFEPTTADAGGWAAHSPVSPPGRFAAVFLGAEQPLLLWGGVADDGSPLNEVQRLEDREDAGEEWTPLTADNPPPARAYAAAASTAARRFIFGGGDVTSPVYPTFPEVVELTSDAGWVVIADAGTPFTHPGLLLPSVVARE